MENDAWFDEAISLCGHGNKDAALDVIFDKIDDWLCEGKFDECNQFLGRLNVEETPTVLLLGVLTITYAADKYLENRHGVFARSWATITARGENAEKLLGNRGTSLQ